MASGGNARIGDLRPRQKAQPGRLHLAGLALFALAVAGPAWAESLRLTFLESHEVHDKGEGFTEPSGLALSADGAHLWAVSDDTKRVFRLGFDGRLLDGPKLKLPHKGMEGIALSADGARLLLVREEGSRIVEVDIGTREVVSDRALADVPGYGEVAMFFEGSPGNKGLEGIAVDRETGRVWVLKEGEPRMMIALSPGLDRITGHRILTGAAGFRESLARSGKLDVSGLAYDAARGLLWIVSDRGERLFLYDAAQDRSSSTPLLATIGGKERHVRHAEGIAIDTERGRLYIVTDDGKDSRLFVYAID